jgi:hypothetical protein
LLSGFFPVKGQEMSFSKDSVITTGYQPVKVACADFDGDEKLDLAVAINDNSRFDPVAVFLNDGDGVISTTADSMYLNTDSPKGMAVGDLNHDQIPDLAVSVYADSTVVILLGNGDGSFTKDTVLSTPTHAGQLLIEDFDKDTNNDLAVVSRYSFLMTYKGDGQGGFAEPTVTSGVGTATDVEAFDMNADNYPDLLIGTGNVRSVRLLMNDGQGNYPFIDNIHTPRTAWYVKAGHFNQDAYPDVAAGSGSYDSDNVFVLLNDGQGNYASPDTMSPGTYVNDVSVGDYNNDQNQDILIADRNGIYILTGAGDGSFSHTDTIDYEEQSYQARSVQSVDIDDDGRIDLVVGRESQISIYYNTVDLTASISDNVYLPDEFYLSQNYPNPFNPVTAIEFQIPNSEWVTLEKFNSLGQKVATLLSASLLSGSHKVEWNAVGFASGAYYYQLRTSSGVTATKKLVLLK